MEEILGLPVVPISASKNEGVDELVEHALHVARYQEKPSRQDFCDKDDHGGAVHRCLHGIMALIEDHAEQAGLPLRFAASRLVEGDAAVEQALGLQQNEKEMVEHIIVQMEQERGLDRNAAMADMRFAFIRRLTAQTVVKPRESKEYRRSRRLDRVLTGRWTAIPIFVIVLSLVIWLSIDVLGAPLQDLLDRGIQWLAGAADAGMASWGVTPAVRSLVVDGVFGGVGTVVSFVPIIIILFFFLSILEDSGYMARVAFVTDKLLRKIGLSGRSIVPLLIGFGCSVPAVMATRTLPSSRDRKMTILLTPFVSCSAKIPIYAFFTNAFFPGHGGLVLVILYLSAILIGILVALVCKHLPKQQHPTPFVMELPNYRMPGAKNVGHLLWDKTKDFLQRAFTVIFIASIVIWILQSFDWRLRLVDPENSMLASIAGLIAPLFRPLGLGDWRIVTSLVTGFLAKESVVATMEVLNVTASMTALTAIPMMAFCLLYTPCVAAIAAVRRELGGKWAIAVVIFQCFVAWVAAFVCYWLAGMFF
jgi:ferrous iron transport protein B